MCFANGHLHDLPNRRVYLCAIFLETWHRGWSSELLQTNQITKCSVEEISICRKNQLSSGNSPGGRGVGGCAWVTERSSQDERGPLKRLHHLVSFSLLTLSKDLLREKSHCWNKIRRQASEENSKIILDLSLLKQLVLYVVLNWQVSLGTCKRWF